ncbi:ATP-dependent helicase [bacterium]|nr:ATP-dependent helicase [bacterium]
MLLNGSLRGNKTELLVKAYSDLLNSGVNPSEILVINLNRYKNQNFIDEVKKLVKTKNPDTSKIQTFFGLCYNSVKDNWEYVQSKIKIGENTSEPNLCGLEVSQYIFSQSIRNNIFNDYLSKINLFHQLFKRYSLIVQNDLSEEEIKERSAILKEGFFEDTQKALNFYKKKTLEYRSFDYLRQIAIFKDIYLNTEYFKNIKYLIIDDADEITYAVFEFIEHLKPQLKDWFIAYDTFGASRCGYLSAYKKSVDKFEEIFGEKAKKLSTNDKIACEAQRLYLNIQKNKKSNPSVMTFIEKNKRLDMLEAAASDIEKMIEKGVKPSQISIITPLVDDMFIFSLSELLPNFDCQILTGSEKLSDNKLVKNLLFLLKLTFQAKKAEFDSREFAGLLQSLLNIPPKFFYKACYTVKDGADFRSVKFNNEEYDTLYCEFLKLLERISLPGLSLSEKLNIAFLEFNRRQISEKDRAKFEFLMKQVLGFENALKDKIDQNYIIKQLENSIISENPSVAEEIRKNAIVVATPQRIIDFELKRDYEIWLDTTSFEWCKEDLGTLYNSWVFNKDWEKTEFIHQDNVALTREKTARVLRKLVLCANKEIRLYSSLYDSFGVENYGGLKEFISPNGQNQKTEYNFIPRPDQKPVLDYKNGKMGVMAVPGAGKTTILLSLVLKLLEEGIKPENIFVVTYMDSAARNFRERIKNITNSELPNISTIHGLALRIIKENANYTRLGLNENFEITDDKEKENIIKFLMAQKNIDGEKYEAFSKSISTLKLEGVTEPENTKYKNINEFFAFYKLYRKYMADNNLIDYDDMLCLALELLEKNPDILSYYQNIFEYIIEDEAQDSTKLQQRLLSLLSGKYNNLVRCGDINQAITTTFTNTNPEDFRKYVKENKCVEMVSSQRCSEPIFSLANSLVDYAQKSDETKNAFYNIKMIPTGNNPKITKKPVNITFKTPNSEKEFIRDKIKNILISKPKTTIALLLRNNYQVRDYESFFNASGLKTIAKTDFLEQKSTFKVIFTILKLIKTPLSNSLALEIGEVLSQNGSIHLSDDDKTFLKKLKTPFLLFNPDELSSEALFQLQSDLEYWLSNLSLSPDVLSVKIGLYYFKTAIEKSNVYLIAMLIRRLLDKSTSVNNFFNELENLSQRPLRSGFRFFSEEDEKGNTEKEGKISIMTLHKSKGDEFDVVFIPEFSTRNYGITVSDTKLKADTFFTKTVKSIVSGLAQKDDRALKLENIDETLRLIYVGITRAKKLLCFTSNDKADRGRKNTLIEKLL